LQREKKNKFSDCPRASDHRGGLPSSEARARAPTGVCPRSWRSIAALGSRDAHASVRLLPSGPAHYYTWRSGSPRPGSPPGIDRVALPRATAPCLARLWPRARPQGLQRSPHAPLTWSPRPAHLSTRAEQLVHAWEPSARGATPQRVSALGRLCLARSRVWLFAVCLIRLCQLSVPSDLLQFAQIFFCRFLCD
jgi:hypothetical protein